MANNHKNIEYDDDLVICDECGWEFDPEEIRVCKKRKLCSFCSNLQESDDHNAKHHTPIREV